MHKHPPQQYKTVTYITHEKSRDVESMFRGRLWGPHILSNRSDKLQSEMKYNVMYEQLNLVLSLTSTAMILYKAEVCLGWGLVSKSKMLWCSVLIWCLLKFWEYFGTCVLKFNFCFFVNQNKGNKFKINNKIRKVRFSLWKCVGITRGMVGR